LNVEFLALVIGVSTLFLAWINWKIYLETKVIKQLTKKMVDIISGESFLK
tara:strand:+ start:3390 stop:3539 length:150 start_codon:yes stop_codon:yes gene_type:complete